MPEAPKNPTRILGLDPGLDNFLTALTNFSVQLSTLEKNCKDFGVRLCPLGDADQGVVHAFAPVLVIKVSSFLI